MTLNDELAPNCWYRAADLFDPAGTTLKDGSTIRTTGSHFSDAPLQMLTGRVTSNRINLAEPADDEPAPGSRYIQFTLPDVDRSHVDRLPPLVSISRQLLRDHVLCLSDSRYMCDLLMRKDDTVYWSRGTVGLVLVLGAEPGNDLSQQSREVQTAFRQGLLDDAGKSRADFRLYIKPLQKKLAALQDSEYLPDDAWRVDVVFANWYEQSTNQWVASPISSDPGALEDLQIQFARQQEWRRFP